MIKCTHDSGGVVICKDKSTLDIDAAKKKLAYFLKRRYYDCNREWPYKNVKPRIMSEKYLIDANIDLINEIDGIAEASVMTHTLDDFIYELREDIEEESIKVEEILQNCDDKTEKTNNLCAKKNCPQWHKI